MIGAMPAIAVGGDRKKCDGSIGYFNRPHKLSLHFRPPLPHHQVTSSPSPTIISPQGIQLPESTTHRLARHCYSKRLIFQLSVLAPLAGALTLFIGLVQLAPGAEGGVYGLPLIYVGTSVLLFGLLVIAIRMLCKWELGRTEQREPLPEIKVNDATCNDHVDVEKAEKEKLVVLENTKNKVQLKNEVNSQQVLRQISAVDGKHKEDKGGGPPNSNKDADKKNSAFLSP